MPASSTEELPASDQYQLQGEAFSRAVRGEIALPYGIEDAIANMRVIDALFRSRRAARGSRSVRRDRDGSDDVPAYRAAGLRDVLRVPGRHFPGVVPAQRVKARTKALASA